MNYVLIYVMEPKSAQFGDTTGWLSFLSNADSIKLADAQSIRIQKGAWLLDRDNDVSALANIVRSAEAFGQTYKVLFLTSDSVPPST